MSNKVALITDFSNYANYQCQQLQKLFKNHIELTAYSYDVETINQPIDAKLIVTSLPYLYYMVKKYISKDTSVITLSHTITNSQYEQIIRIPSGTQVMVVNNRPETTIETIVLFHHLGIDHLDFVPFYPQMKNVPKLDIAITPGEAHRVPNCVKQIVDIGHRVVDADTITEIAMKLNLEHLLNEDYFLEYFKSIKIIKNSLTSLFDKTNIIESRLLSLLNIIDDGIIVTNNDGIICACNEKALSILGEKNSIIDEKITSIIPQIQFKKVLKTSVDTGYDLIKLNGYNISIKLVPVITAGRPSGILVIINRFDEKEKSQYKLRSQLLGKGHKAKYTFENIISRDSAFIKMKIWAEKRAKSDTTVLITGDSGTGKEMFAQAIHNASKRKDYPFVAINCAALPESLLESELFGYEEGAFTGAKKSGKFGLFELAHKGTIFLDEIGEMSNNLQARLLRVLEEREVMRIGGDSVIHVDIRIIAATNRNLWNLIEEGKFRKDLYYRLNVLPIYLPPLSERKDDILLLFEHFKKTMDIEFTLSYEVENIFYNYPWYGNVREIKNCVEYLASLDKDLIEEKDIANIIKRQLVDSTTDNEYDKELSSFISAIRLEKDIYGFVLKCLYTSYKNKQRVGRRSILKVAQDGDVFLTEAQIRKVLNILEFYGLVRLSNGRGGTTITALGIKALQLLMPNSWTEEDRTCYNPYSVSGR